MPVLISGSFTATQNNVWTRIESDPGVKSWGRRRCAANFCRSPGSAAASQTLAGENIGDVIGSNYFLLPATHTPHQDYNITFLPHPCQYIEGVMRLPSHATSLLTFAT